MQKEQNVSTSPVRSATVFNDEIENLIDKLKSLNDTVRDLPEKSQVDKESRDNEYAVNPRDLQIRGLFTMVQDIAQLFLKFKQLETNLVNASNILSTRLSTVENQFPNLLNNAEMILERLTAVEKFLQELSTGIIPAAASGQQLTFMAPRAGVASASSSATATSDLTVTPVQVATQTTGETVKNTFKLD